MIPLTPQERTVLSFLAVVLLAGSSLHYIFQKYPFLKDSVRLTRHSGFYREVDINRASLEELVRVPSIGERTARRILQYRREHGPFHSVEELKLIPGIQQKNYQKFSKFLKVSKTL